MTSQWDGPSAAAFERQITAGLLPTMRKCDAVTPIWTGEIDGKLAVEVGAAILLDKPIVLIVRSGTKVPEKLMRVVDRVVEASNTSTQGLADRLAGVIGDLAREGRLGRGGGAGDG